MEETAHIFSWEFMYWYKQVIPKLKLQVVIIKALEEVCFGP